MTCILGLIVVFLIYTSEDPHWGGGFWEQWLISHLHWPEPVISTLVFWIRKSLHFWGYGILGLLFWFYFRLWRFRLPQFIGILATSAVAALDESTQATSAFRMGKPEDVLLDLSGALVVGLIVRFFHRRQVKRSG